jgi:two-component system, OmpR family, phosphate regulon response regulator PhoB
MARPLVLVVEDDPDNLDSIVDLLRMEGYDAVAASNGHEARERASAAGLSLMIVDYLLPDTTGTELVRQLRQQRDGPPVPVVFLTAAVDPIDSPADARVVKKPIAFEDLLDVLTRCCGPAPLRCPD